MMGAAAHTERLSSDPWLRACAERAAAARAARQPASLVARAKLTSRSKLTAYADAGAAIVELSRRGVRARVRSPDRMALAELAADAVSGTWVLSGDGIRLPWDFATWVRGKRRGIIQRFTDASRRRFVYRLCNWRGADRYITLTTRRNERFAPRSSRALGRFLNWARGRGLRSYVWVRERQERGAIHFHIWTDGLLAPAEEIREEWLRACGEDHDYASRRHAVDVRAWSGPAWYAVAEGSKRFQKQAPPVDAFGSAGRFWSCSHSVSRAHVSVPLGVDALRWFRRWLRKTSREYRRTVKDKVFHARRESLMLRHEWSREERSKAWEFAARVARNGARWLQRFGTAVPFPKDGPPPKGRRARERRRGPRAAGGYLMLDRLQGVEERLPAVFEALLDRDTGRGVALAFPT